MATKGIISAFRDWLPVPRYRFVGGPFDGETRTVTLYETARGMEPPRRWRIAAEPEGLPQGWRAAEVAIDAVMTVHEYEFVPVDWFNAGFYRYVPPA